MEGLDLILVLRRYRRDGRRRGRLSARDGVVSRESPSLGKRRWYHKSHIGERKSGLPTPSSSRPHHAGDFEFPALQISPLRSKLPRSTGSRLHGKGNEGLKERSRWKPMPSGGAAPAGSALRTGAPPRLSEGAEHSECSVVANAGRLVGCCVFSGSKPGVPGLGKGMRRVPIEEFPDPFGNNVELGFLGRPPFRCFFCLPVIGNDVDVQVENFLACGTAV